MKLFFILIVLASCGTYTDPEREKLSLYRCEKGHEVDVKHSDDYETIILRYNKDQHLLHNFVSDSGSGYRNENFLWLTKGKKAVLVKLEKDGSEKILLNECLRVEI